MWKSLWPELLDEEVPIKHITNGVHVRSWISHEMENLLTRYLGPSWIREPEDQSVWDKISKIPSSELWRVHERRRENLVAFTRRKLMNQVKSRGGTSTEISQAEQVLSPDSLTIGFARRFATYKRATLIFNDPDRLAKILNNKEMPVQIIFAGKAHPKDDKGKDLIKKIIHFCRQERFRHNVVFVEDYDISISRKLVQGVDIWLNTPCRLFEASGTSGMKVNFNGGLNLSILDGWWYEAFNAESGWAIGQEENYNNTEYQDRVESNAIYDLLEKEICPLFYKRGQDEIPYHWLELMKSAQKNLSPKFNTNRMVCEYVDQFYINASKRYTKVIENNMEGAKDLAAWKTYIRINWNKVKIENVEAKTYRPIPVHSKLELIVTVNLGEFTPSDVKLQTYYGMLDAERNITKGQIQDINLVEKKDNYYIYKGEIDCSVSGKNGFTVRIIPHHENMVNPLDMGLITWA